MSISPSSSLARQGRLLHTIIKAIREERRMRPPQVAAAMGIGLRTYEEFEAGRGRLDLEKVRLFGLATDSDAVAITLGLLFGSKDSALRNKGSTIMWITLREFEEGVGDQMAVIPGSLILETLRQAFNRLRDYLLKRDTSAERYLEEEIRRLYTPDKVADENPADKTP
jgi:transcriptional regulator with XRE-family HTH domain